MKLVIELVVIWLLAIVTVLAIHYTDIIGWGLVGFYIAFTVLFFSEKIYGER